MSFILPKNLKKRLKKTLLSLIALYILVGLGLYMFQESFIFQPTKLSKDYSFRLNYQYEEFLHNIDEGVLINALLIKADNPKGVIFYCHGNAGNLQRWGSIVEYFVAMNYDVYVMDYRGYGKSEGVISEDAYFEDVEFCYQHLKQFWNEEDIIVYGRSLGTSAATKVASNNNPKRLVLETPFHSITDVARDRFPMYPIKGMLKYEFPTYQFINSVNCPISIIHGTRDFTIPFSSAERLFKVSPKEIITFTKVESGGHNNLNDFKEYHDLMAEIFQ